MPRLCWRCEPLESITLPKKKKTALHKMKKALKVQTPNVWKAARTGVLCVVPHTNFSKRNLLPTAVRPATAEFMAYT